MGTGPDSSGSLRPDEIDRIYGAAVMAYIQSYNRRMKWVRAGRPGGTSEVPEPDPRVWLEGHHPDVRPRLREFLNGHTRRNQGSGGDDTPTQSWYSHVSLNDFVINLEPDGTEVEFGRGGMGRIVSAHDKALDRPVAIKFMLDRTLADPIYVEQFRSEARLQSQLQHAGVPPVYHIGHDTVRGPFIVMQPIHGPRLTERMKGGAEKKELLDIFLTIAQTVAHAHQEQKLHLDLKPANVLIGNNGQVWVMDWGLAKVTRQTEGVVRNNAGDPQFNSGGLTPENARNGPGNGTPMYMSPEQAQGDAARVGPQSDVFALGAILCQILTGETLYAPTSTAEIRAQAAEWTIAGAFDRLDACGADSELVSLCKWCLSKHPADRPANGGAVAAVVVDYRLTVAARLLASERETAAAVARATEAVNTRREAEAKTVEVKKKLRWMSVGMALAPACVLACAWGGWQYKSSREAQQQQLLLDQSAARSWITRWEEALLADDVVMAEVARNEIERLPESGKAAISSRLERCESDLALLKDLNRIDNFRWIPLGGRLPTHQRLAAELSSAYRRIGFVASTTSAPEAARRITASLVKDRLLGAMDLWLITAPSAEVRAVLAAADPDEYREGIRDAVLAGNKDAIAVRVGQANALEQPPRFAAVLGQLSMVPVARRRVVLELALGDRPGSLSLLMSLGGTYPHDRREGAGDRTRWFHAAVSSHPECLAARHNLGDALRFKGDVDGAIREHTAAIKLDPDSPIHHDALGSALMAKGDVDGAIREHEAAIRLDQASPHPHTNRGVALWSRGDVDGAIREYNTAIRLDPTSPQPHTEKGTALQTKGDVEGAIREHEAAIRLDPTFAVAHNNLGKALHAKGDRDGAIRAYTVTMEIDPEYASPHYNLGNVLYSLDDMDGAIRECSAVIALDPAHAGAHNLLGDAFSSKGDVEGSIWAYKSVIRLDPRFAPAHFKLGLLLSKRGDVDGATHAFKTTIERGYKIAAAQLELGNIQYSKGDLDGAALEYQDAIRIDPKSVFAHSNLGVILFRKDDVEGAGNAFRSAAGIDPNFAPAHNGLGNVLFSKGDVDGACREYKTAIHLDPKYALPHDGLANALRKKGDRNGAIAAYREAAKRKSNLSNTYHNLSMLLAERDEPFAALQALRDGILVDPSFIRFYRYNLACFACLVADHQAKDAPAEIDRDALRRETIGWLRDELTLQQQLANNAGNVGMVHSRMLHWLANRNLKSVRDTENLRADEREIWDRLWADVRKLRDDTSSAK